MKKDPVYAWAENLLASACRVPGFEGHGGQIPECSKQEDLRIEIVNVFLRCGVNPNVRNRRKVTPLHMSCRFDLPRVAAFLISNGADVNAYDEVRETPLFRAVNLGYEECVKVLLTSDIDLGFQNRKGYTVIHRAAQRGKRHILPLLLDAGAPANISDRVGKIPIDYARNAEIKQRLDATR